MSDVTVSPLELICLGSSLAFTGLFYYLYRQKRTEINELKKVPKFNISKHLQQILKVSPENVLQYAVVEGKVQPVGEPLQSKNFISCTGVIQKIVKKEQKKILNHLTNTWMYGEQTVKEHINTVPFKLVPSTEDSNISVHVLSPLSAAELCLEPVREVLHKPKEGFLDYVAQQVSGEKPVGFLEIEEMLQVGTTMTGIGELVLYSDKIIKLQPPSNGKEYLLIASDFKTFLTRQESTVKMWKIFTAVFGLVGFSLLAAIIYRLHHRRRNGREGS